MRTSNIHRRSVLRGLAALGSTGLLGSALGRVLTTAACAALVLATGSALAADHYPSKPIRLVVPYQAGGATDITARTLGEKLSARLGQPVLVDNRGGAGGVSGTDHAFKSPADGYTLLVALGTTMLINQCLYERLP